MPAYRLPARVNERVALAPHLDLFMAGIRYGTVTEVAVKDNARIYKVFCNVNTHVWLGTSDLLGVV